MGPFVKGVLSICSNGSAAKPTCIYGKNTLKNLLQNQENFEADLGEMDW